jgi:menaquinone-9 beta-reductase
MEKENKYDVVIVGAGPAGSTAAYYIDGLRVLIVDKFNFPRHKSCGGGLMSSKDWHLELENYAKIKNKLTSVYSCDSIKMYWNGVFIAGRKFKHLFDQIDRYEFDNLLLETALEKENVSFLKFELEKIQKINFEGQEGFKLCGSGKEIFASFIIGADGVHSKVSKFLGNKNLKSHQFGHCMEYDIVCEKKDTHIHTIPGYKMEVGYAWLFPTSTGYQAGIGIVRKPRKSLKVYLDSFVDWAVKQNLMPSDYSIAKTSGGALPLKLAKKYATDRILLCGDAMGLVKVLTGEGIYYAMKSGKIVGQVLSQNQENIAKRYKKKVRPLVRDVFITPYIPPKIFTLTFWSCFFYIGKVVDYLSKRLRVWNIFLDFFMKKVVHRKSFRKESYYYDEKITPL